MLFLIPQEDRDVPWLSLLPPVPPGTTRTLQVLAVHTQGDPSLAWGILWDTRVAGKAELNWSHECFLIPGMAPAQFSVISTVWG